jgi:hypothetical protein
MIPASAGKAATARLEGDAPAPAVRVCPRHGLELREGSLLCPRGHRCRTWVVMLRGKAVAAGRIGGRVKVWLLPAALARAALRALPSNPRKC